MHVSEVDPAVRRGEAHFQARLKDFITSDRACTRCINEKGVAELQSMHKLDLGVAEHARGVSTKTVEQTSRNLARDHH